MWDRLKDPSSAVPAENIIVEGRLAAAGLDNGNARQQPPIQRILIGGVEKDVDILSGRTLILPEERSQQLQARIRRLLVSQGRKVIVLRTRDWKRQQTCKNDYFGRNESLDHIFPPN